MTALLWASYKGHLPVVRELVKVYKADLFQKNKVRLTLSHALVTMHIFCHKTWLACKMLRCYVSSLILYMYKRVVISKIYPTQTSVPDTQSKHCMACMHNQYC